MKSRLFSLACIALLAWACSKEESAPEQGDLLKVQLNVVSDLLSRAAASEAENAVNSLDVYLFDATTGLLEATQLNVTPSAPSEGNVAGELKVGEVTFTPTDNKNKHVLVIANATSDNITLPSISLGSTTYTNMLNAVTKLNPQTASPTSPFVMSGYANGVNAQSQITVSLRRRVAKLTVVNESAGLVITSLQLKQVVNQAYLFKEGHPASGDNLQYVDHTAVAGSTSAFYVFPQPAATNNMTLTVSGTLNGSGFVQTVPVKPMKEGVAQDMSHNAVYQIKLSVEDQTVSAETVEQIVDHWDDGDDIPAGMSLIQGTTGPLTWTLSGDGTLTISGEGAMPDYTYLTGGPWCSNKSKIKTVVINYGVTTIGREAFIGCVEITDVMIPGSVTSIDGFNSCLGLTHITIPASVTSLKPQSFWSCNNLTQINIAADNLAYASENGVVLNKTKNTLIICPAGKEGSYTIPSSVTTIDNSAFGECNKLTSVTIPNSVITIGEQAFIACRKLMSITIPSSVTVIKGNSFLWCDDLTEIEVDTDNPAYVSSEGILFNKTMTSVIKYPGGKQDNSYIIPNSIANIGNSAFYACKLTSVTIPASITNIEFGAFGFCRALTSITIMATTPPVLSNDVFFEVAATLYVPAGCVEAYRADAKWNAAFATILEQE